MRLGLSRARLPESARSVADVTVLSRDEVAALTHETESSRLARCKLAATKESDSDSGDERSTSPFASQIRNEKTRAERRQQTPGAAYFTCSAVKARAQEISEALATYRELHVVQ